MPPTDFGLQHVEEAAVDQGLDDGLGEFADFVVFRGAAAIIGARSRAFWTWGWTVGMVRLLLRESAVPVDYPRPGRTGQAMATGSACSERADRGVARSVSRDAMDFKLNHSFIDTLHAR